jgi:carbon starvation protein
MSLPAILAVSAIILLIAYRTYGKFIADKLSIDNKNVTPAHRLADGVDYIPSKPAVVLGHHFASIAGAGPIVGPIIAVTFGWIPAIIWILIGGIFFGAVHDVSSMVASLRHQGKSIGVIIHKHIGDSGKLLFLIFSFSTLVLIIAVFADIVAKTFVSDPGAASASVFFIALAILFGMINRKYNSKKAFLVLTIVGVLTMYGMIYIGSLLPLNLTYMVWVGLLLIYAFIASVTPISFILQPRDYLNSFLLYGLMLFGVVGIFWANPDIMMTTEVTYNSPALGYMFPVLFVTIACGAISGFHSLVASGTTAKQLDREGDAKIVGYGGMLIESFLAIISVCAVIVLDRGDYVAQLKALGPVTLFSQGLGGMIASLGIPPVISISFVALTVSAFALTTLDTCTRLARFSMQELCEGNLLPGADFFARNRFAATLFPLVLTVILLMSGEFTTLWPIFGSANQLLAALALLAVTVWLYRIGVNPLFTLLPMIFMFAVTLSSLFIFAYKNYAANQYLLAIIAVLLSVLSMTLIVLARRSLKQIIAETKLAESNV